MWTRSLELGPSIFVIYAEITTLLKEERSTKDELG